MVLHVQLSVDTARWPDNMLAGILTDKDGRELTGPEAREALKDLKARGFDVVPCHCGNFDAATGRCKGA